MCGFMAVIGSIDKEEFMTSFHTIQHRGPDQTAYYMDEDVSFGFHRLSIMGLEQSAMQPMHHEHLVYMCNGELYNFKQLRKQCENNYKFQSNSDCEVILPLYQQYQEHMLNMLDGEFAMVVYDKSTHEVFAARDHLGIRPLFYGYHHGKHIAFASEAKALHSCCEQVFPFPIGSYYKDGEFHTFLDVSASTNTIHREMEDIKQGIHERLYNAVVKRLDSDVPLGFLLSGGLDSSLVCAIASSHLQKPIKTFAIGMREDAIDLAYARRTADFLKSDHHEFYMDRDEVIALLPEVIWHLETFDITTIRASIAMYALCKRIRETSDVRVLLSGEVSDELFGYKYTDYAPTPAAFQEESKKRLRELYEYDVLRSDRCIAAHGIEARVPFSDYAFCEYVMQLDPAVKMNTYGMGKYLLRSACTSLLPDDILMREKAAFSDAVGHSMVDIIKEYANQQYSDTQLSQAQQTYTHVPPISKEALLYRELFEQFYPNRGVWIDAYWMPNQTWPHCDVDDPSARVLPNYGMSGK